MATSVEIARQDDDNDLGLTAQQVIALEKLAELGAEPARTGANGKPIYSREPKIRAYQLIFEGKFAGAGRGQGRPRKQRAAEVLAEHIRTGLTNKMKKALDRALSKDAGIRVNLDAVKLAMEIERGERKLQIEEEEHDGNLGDTREQLLGTLFELVGDPATAAAIEGSAEEITEAEVVNEGDFHSLSTAEAQERARRASAAGSTRSHRDPSRPESNGSDAGRVGDNGRNGASGDRQEGSDSRPKASIRRAAERRRAMAVGQGQPPR